MDERQDSQRQITELLAALRAGESGADGRDAFDRLLPLVYDELRVIAHRQLRAQRSDHTLNTTALVHEAYLKLAGHARLGWNERGHFFAAAARAMRHILVSYARRHRAAKRGGGRGVVTLSDALAGAGGAATVDIMAAADERAEAFVALDDALTRLEALDARLARVVECRFFGGLADEETAAALGVSTRTVRREWARARAWLLQALEE